MGLKVEKKSILALRGMGEEMAKRYEKLGVSTLEDLLRLYPRGYEDWTTPLPIQDTPLNEISVVRATVLETPRDQRAKGKKLITRVTVTDGIHDMVLTFFNNRYISKILKPGQTYLFRGRVDGSLLCRQMVAPEFTVESGTPSFLPVYPCTQGVTSRMTQRYVKSALELLPGILSDPLPQGMREKYRLCSLDLAIKAIHFPPSEEDLSAARRRLIFEEFLVLQLGLMEIKRGRRVENLHPIPDVFPKGFTELLPFALTGAQHRAISEAIEDMAGESPMNRLIQGDVGSGKTAVAAALCYAVIASGMQAAMMAPTEILATQHYQSLSALLAPAGIRTELLTGSVKAAEKKRIYSALAAGEIQLIIGTHALISQQVAFQSLGLVITDEQHRFGVGQRSALAEKGEAPHLLVMSATPIPRTLALMMYGDLDISILDELPPGRQKIDTFLIDSQKRARAFRFVQKHLDEGRQGYLICPLIQEGESDAASVIAYGEMVKEQFPHAAVGILHGKMKPREKEEIMSAFSRGELQLLVSTTVVEVGVDVPNAVIMLIENAERYGLSQLHQLRGRIGRGKHKSTCILVSDAQNEDTLRRLVLFRDTSDGFKIADADLKLRGPGDFFGRRQHGLPQLKIADLTNDMDVLRDAQCSASRLMRSGAYFTAEFSLLRKEVHRLFSKNGSEIPIL